MSDGAREDVSTYRLGAINDQEARPVATNIDTHRRVRICWESASAAITILNGAIDALPPLPANPQCCRSQRLMHVESGVVRSTQITSGRDSGHAHCSTNGWDDISEGGDVHPVVECTACGHLWAEPTVLHWD